VEEVTKNLMTIVGSKTKEVLNPDKPVSEPTENLPTTCFLPAIVLEKVARLLPFWEEEE